VSSQQSGLLLQMQKQKENTIRAKKDGEQENHQAKCTTSRQKRGGGGAWKTGKTQGKDQKSTLRNQATSSRHHVDTVNTKNPESKRRKCLYRCRALQKVSSQQKINKESRRERDAKRTKKKETTLKNHIKKYHS
jgi:hypothetical protein